MCMPMATRRWRRPCSRRRRQHDRRRSVAARRLGSRFHYRRRQHDGRRSVACRRWQHRPRWAAAVRRRRRRLHVYCTSRRTTTTVVVLAVADAEAAERPERRAGVESSLEPVTEARRLLAGGAGRLLLLRLHPAQTTN
ncbi:Os03g0360200 [Oryza sativa Japonica Group]|uniref:Os03g0360200 protein n=1 Tax=Oryza sativa subsp. japonica TaxID=39947 RepID=A0A0P0VXQ6_ORYSJ|nr:hypothetical protein EE612_017527 [Oryza sativa]BAS84278.1 Os03g0360200 [Oryza sativa Japonica Group]